MDAELIPTQIDLLSAERFEPARYSIPDLHFLMENLGTPPAVAMRKTLAPGVIKVRVKELLTDVYNLEQIRAAEDGFLWAGIDELQDSMQRFLDWHERSLELKRRRVKDASGRLITHPSMYGWDEDGTAYKFAVDSDSAEMVRTEILNDGSRKAFGVHLLQSAKEKGPHISEIAPWVKGPAKQADRARDAVLDIRSEKDSRIAFLKCSICDFTQQYDSKDRTTRQRAMARMSKHMRDAKTNQNRHRLLLAKMGR